MEVDEPRLLHISKLDRDSDVSPPSRDVWVEVRSADLENGLEPKTWGFKNSAELLVPSLLDLPGRTQGNFTELAVDLLAPFFPDHPEQIYEVTLQLRGKTIDSKVFRNFTQRHHFIIPTQVLFEKINNLTLTAGIVLGGAETPRFFVRVFYVQRDRLVHMLETNSIWIFSTARSGSTWLANDILCWDSQVRPMDEPGVGKMFAPLDWIAERFYDLANKRRQFESGLSFETGTSVRYDASVIAPFEREFIFGRNENQIWSSQNWKMYLGLLKETVFRHVVNEWGLIDYQKVAFKMPNDSHAADVIMQAFPVSFMIFLMRDGRDVMKSRFSPFASMDLAETTDPQMRLYAIAFYSHFWNFQVDIIQSAFDAHAPERRLLLHYEKLRRGPREELGVVLDRIGMPVSDEQLDALVAKTSLENMPIAQRGPDKPRQTGEIGKYARVFSPAEIELMEAIMGPNLRRFGYQLDSDAKGDSGAPMRVPQDPILLS